MPVGLHVRKSTKWRSKTPHFVFGGVCANLSQGHVACVVKALIDNPSWRTEAVINEDGEPCKAIVDGQIRALPALEARALEQALDAPLFVDIDRMRRRHFRQAGHRQHIATDHHHEFGTCCQPDLADVQRMVAGCPAQFGVHLIWPQEFTILLFRILQVALRLFMIQ